MAQSKFCQRSSYLLWMSAALLQNNGAWLMDGHQGTAAFPASALLPATEEEIHPGIPHAGELQLPHWCLGLCLRSPCRAAAALQGLPAHRGWRAPAT